MLLDRHIALPDPDATDRLGASLAAALPSPQRVIAHLIGDLGAGKSSLARALLRALGAQGALRSPTYTLVERHRLHEGEAAHLDLYRIADPEELEYLALDELADAARLWLIEWPQRGGDRLPAADLRISLSIQDHGRAAQLTALSPRGAAWLSALPDAQP